MSTFTIGPSNGPRDGPPSKYRDKKEDWVKHYHKVVKDTTGRITGGIGNDIYLWHYENPKTKKIVGYCWKCSDGWRWMLTDETEEWKPFDAPNCNRETIWFAAHMRVYNAIVMRRKQLEPKEVIIRKVGKRRPKQV